MKVVPKDDEPSEVKIITSNKRFINLEMLLREIDSTVYVKFDRVVPTSLLTVESIMEREPGKHSKEDVW